MHVKTPGVYVTETDGYSNSVAAVATAVPAFVGCTGKTHGVGSSGQQAFLRRLIDRIWAVLWRWARAGVQSPGAGARRDRRSGGWRAWAASGVFIGWSGLLVDARARQGRRAFCDAPGLAALFSERRRALLHRLGGRYSDEIAAGNEKEKGLIDGLQTRLMAPAPTMLVVPDAVLLSRADCATVQATVVQHCGQAMRNRVAILDIWGVDGDRRCAQTNSISDFRHDIGASHQGFAAAYGPWPHTSLEQVGQLDHGIVKNPAALANLIRNEPKLDELAANDNRAGGIQALLLDLLNEAVAWKIRLTATIATIATIANNAQTDGEKAKVTQALDDCGALSVAMAARRSQLHPSLRVVRPEHQATLDQACAPIKLMPPSPAMAGIDNLVTFQLKLQQP
jgi:hypothetical protein